jgi:VIT1/CCC1 family predicted Fe2+/Mn2+ transporter
VAFGLGGLLPLIAVTGPWEAFRIQATVLSVALALIITGYVAAKIGKAKSGRGIVRNLVVSGMTMGVTYVIGLLVGTHLV